MADYKTIHGTTVKSYTTDPDNPIEGQDMSASGGFGVAGVAADNTSALAIGGALPSVTAAVEEWSSTSVTTKVLTD